MKMIYSAIAVLAMSFSPALAGNVSSGSSSTAGSQAGAQAVVQQIYGKGHKTAASAIAPGLTASGLSCNGSGAIGGAGGGWGISLGLTTPDKPCNTRENAKYVHGVTGDQGAAKEVLCDDPQIRAAFRRAGRPCADDIRTFAAPVAARYGQPVQRQKVSGRGTKLDLCLRRAAKDSSVSCRVYQ